MRRLLLPVLISFVLLASYFPFESSAAGSLPLAEPQFTVAAKAALLMEPASGVIIYAQNENERLPPASLTKIMTMLIIMEAVDSGRVSMDDTIKTSRFASGMGGSQVYLKEGETFTLREMLISIAVVSANDACVAVAEHLYTTEDDFVRMMNSRAQELGMKNSHFVNVHGLPADGHYMSAADIGIVARELIEKHPDILKFTSIQEYTLRPGVTELRNTNELLEDYRGADGLKTGHTDEAGWCLVGTAERDGMRLLSVVLGTDSSEARVTQCERLLDYGFRNFERYVAAKKGQELGEVSVPDASPSRIQTTAPAEISTVIPRGKSSQMETRIQPREGIKAPVHKGDIIADLEILRSGQVVGREPAAAARDAGRANFIVRAWRALIRWIGGLFGH